MRTIRIDVAKVTVLVGWGTDKVCIHSLNYPSPYPSSVDDSPLSFDFQVQAGKGVEYCREKLGIEPDEVIHMNQKTGGLMKDE